MPRFTEVTFVTASVPATSSLNHNEILGDSTFDILKLKIVPSIVGGTSEAQVYERDTFLVADLVYGTNPFAATGFDPVQKDSAGVETEALRGFVTPYEDQDVTGELHIKLVNNDSQAKTYTITIVYETVPSTSVVDIDDLGDVVITAVTADEFIQWNGSTWINQTFAEAGLITGAHVHDTSDITTGVLGLVRGGTGQATAQAAMDALSPVTTLGDTIYRDASNNVRLAGNITTAKQFLSQTGTGTVSAAPAWAAIVSGDLPSHVHSAADITTGELAIARGGTGQATALLAFNALSPSTTLGDIIFHDGTDDDRLAGNITSTKNFLIQTGTGAVSAAPSWGTIASGDIPTHNHNASDIDAGVLVVARGGTDLGTTPTNGQLLIGNGTDYTLAVLIGDTNEIEITNGAGSINVGLPAAVRVTTSLAVGGAPAASAGLELGGTTKAVLVSRLTTTERDALTAVDGMVVYNSSVSEMQGRVGGAWIDLGLGGGFVSVSGTPVDNQLGIWTDASTIEGVTNLTWDGSDLVVTGSVGVGGAPSTSAGLELSSTTKAVLFSRMTTTQRDALTAVNGMVVYNSTTTNLEGRISGSWINLGFTGSFVDISGTPVNNQLAIWTDANTIEGVTNVTWDGSDLIVVGDIGIGAAPSASAGLELSSTDRAVLVSRMNTTQRDALTAADGMIVYNTSTSQMEGRVLGAWIDLGVGGSGFVDIGGTPVVNQLALWVDSNTIKGDANFTWDGTSLIVGTVGPHAIGTTTQNWNRLRLGGDFTSGGGGPDKAALLSIDGKLTGLAGDTSFLTHVLIAGAVTTQGATEVIPIVSTLRLEEPNITLGSGDAVTNSAVLFINSVSTIADNDYAIWVNAGGVRLDVSLIVGGSDVVNTSVGIELSSTTRAMLVSRMDTTQRDALTGVDGMILYNTTTSQMEARVGGTFAALGGGESVESTSLALVLS